MRKPKSATTKPPARYAKGSGIRAIVFIAQLPTIWVFAAAFHTWIFGVRPVA
jgi:hypothetical protein